MRNDARPIGEKLRDIDEHARPERGMEKESPAPPSETRDRQAFVTDRDVGDEESRPNQERPKRNNL